MKEFLHSIFYKPLLIPENLFFTVNLMPKILGKLRRENRNPLNRRKLPDRRTSDVVKDRRTKKTDRRKK